MENKLKFIWFFCIVSTVLLYGTVHLNPGLYAAYRDLRPVSPLEEPATETLTQFLTSRPTHERNVTRINMTDENHIVFIDKNEQNVMDENRMKLNDGNERRLDVDSELQVLDNITRSKDAIKLEGNITFAGFTTNLADISTKHAIMPMYNTSTKSPAVKRYNHLPYKMLLKPAECLPETFVLVLTFTTSSRAAIRKAGRDTWGGLCSNSKSRAPEGPRCQQVFVNGVKPGAASPSQQLMVEHIRFNDILQYDFLDTYRNLTTKTLAAMNFAPRYCPHVPYILKADSDTIVNLPNIMSMLEETKPSRSVLGVIFFYNMPVLFSGRNGVDKKYYSESVYPPYSSGPCYLVTSDLLGEVLEQASRTYYLVPNEDAFVTGILMQNITMKHIQMHGKWKKNLNEDNLCSFKKNSLYVLQEIHRISLIYEAWNKTLNEACKAETLE